MSEDFYRKTIEDAEAVKKARNDAQQQQHQQAQNAAARSLAASKDWYEKVFLPEIAAANAALKERQASFHIHRAVPIGSGFRCDFTLARQQNSSQLYVLIINDGKYSIVEHILPAPNAQNRSHLAAKARNGSPIEKYKNLNTAGDEETIPLILSEIIKERFG